MSARESVGARRDWAPWVVGAVTAVAGIVLGRIWTLDIALDWVLADAGHVLNPGMWMREGVVPYRDFQHNWGPYAPLLGYATYGVLGERESASRLVTALALALMAMGTCAYARRYLSPAGAVAAALLAWTLLTSHLNIAYANVFCLPLAIWALHVAAGPPTGRRAFIAGLLGGVAIAFKISAGGAIAAMAWVVLLSPRPGCPTAARWRGADPLWVCAAAYVALTAAMTRNTTPAQQLWFVAAAAGGFFPLLGAARRAGIAAHATSVLGQRWRLGGWFILGATVAQAGWLPYYARHFSIAGVFDLQILAPMRWGPNLYSLPMPPPTAPTLGVLAVLAVSALALRHRWALAGATGITLLSAGWYLSPLATFDWESCARAWTNVTATMPWVVLGAAIATRWPRATRHHEEAAWLHYLGVGIGTQAIVCFPWGDLSHLAYLAPYTAVGTMWLVERQWPVQGNSVPRWFFWARVLIPLAVVGAEAEGRSRVWRHAWREAKGWPGAAQVAPPRANVWAPQRDAQLVGGIALLLQAHPAVPRDRLLSYPMPYFYWLTNTTSPLYADYVWPGLLTPEAEAKEVSRLRARAPDMVVLRADPPWTIFALPIIEASFPQITGYLKDEYELWFTAPPYRLLVPRGTHAASAVLNKAPPISDAGGT